MLVLWRGRHSWVLPRVDEGLVRSVDRTEREVGVVKPLCVGVVKPLRKALAEALPLWEGVLESALLGWKAHCGVGRGVRRRC